MKIDSGCGAAFERKGILYFDPHCFKPSVHHDNRQSQIEILMIVIY